MAASTWEGTGAPLEQALPAEAQTPSSSRTASNRSLRHPATTKLQWPGSRRVRSPVGSTPGISVSRLVNRPASRVSTATSGSRRRSASSAATPKPEMPATFSVPLRRPRSWPPPVSWAAGKTPCRATSAPTPWGPYALWALRLIRSTPRLSRPRRSRPRPWTASVWTQTRGLRARTAPAIEATSSTVPTSLLASITDTRTVSGLTAAATSAGSTCPLRSQPTTVSSAAPVPASASAVARTASCSTALTTR